MKAVLVTRSTERHKNCTNLNVKRSKIEQKSISRAKRTISQVNTDENSRIRDYSPNRELSIAHKKSPLVTGSRLSHQQTLKLRKDSKSFGINCGKQGGIQVEKSQTISNEHYLRNSLETKKLKLTSELRQKSTEYKQSHLFQSIK